MCRPVSAAIGTSICRAVLLYVFAHISTETRRIMTLFAGSSSIGCLSCGNPKKSDTLSCCARCGAWFKNFGDTENAKCDRTRSEGIRDYKSMSERNFFCCFLMYDDDPSLIV